MRKFSNQRGPRAFHNGTQLVRAHLGLTQQDLASLMRVSREAVAMDERGDRYLPWDKAAPLRQLGQVLPAPDGPASLPPVPAPVLSADDREVLDLRRLALELEARPVQQKLARCQVRLAQARLWQQALPALRAACPADDARTRQWLDGFAGQAADTLAADGGTPALLELRLATIAFETAEINRLLNTGE